MRMRSDDDDEGVIMGCIGVWANYEKNGSSPLEYNLN